MRQAIGDDIFWLEAVFGIPYGARDKVPRQFEGEGGVRE